jgi:hypothetical protein
MFEIFMAIVPGGQRAAGRTWRVFGAAGAVAGAAAPGANQSNSARRQRPPSSADYGHRLGCRATANFGRDDATRDALRDRGTAASAAPAAAAATAAADSELLAGHRRLAIAGAPIAATATRDQAPRADGGATASGRQSRCPLSGTQATSTW